MVLYVVGLIVRAVDVVVVILVDVADSALAKLVVVVAGLV